MEFVGIGETPEDGVVAGRFEILDREFEEGIEPRRIVPRVEVQRHEGEFQMGLRIVVQRAGVVGLHAIAQAPLDDIAPRHKIQVQVQRDGVVQPETEIVNRAVVDEAEVESDDPFVLPPDEIVDAVRDALADQAEVFFVQFLKLEIGPLVSGLAPVWWTLGAEGEDC